MRLILNVYTNETFSEIKRVCEAERVRIPYRVGIYVAQMLDQVDDITDEKQILKVVTSSTAQVTKVIKATFKVSEAELDCVDIGEMYDVAMELYRYAIEKFQSLNGDNSPNVGVAAGI